MHKVLIRPLRLEDAKISYKWRNDNEVWKLTGSKPNRIITEEIEKEWLSNKLKEINSFRFAIEVDNIYVGNIQLTDVVENESAEYHIFIGDKSYWRKGVANLATAQIIIFAKNVINLKAIYLSVNPENLSAIKVYEKNGFEKMNEKIEMHLKLSSTKTPTVSVFMMAYNHALFISEAIEGVLMQKTNFDFDIVIGEDCSTDNTRQIIFDYQKKYPGKFKLLLHDKNIGALANQMEVFEACTGKYIALCEGDDYWTDPLKLQKQVDFLEANEEYGLVHTNCDNLYQQSGKIVRNSTVKSVPEGWVLQDIFSGRLNIKTTTVCFSKKIYEDFFPSEYWDLKIPIGDWPLWLVFAKNSKIGYISDTTAVYRNGQFSYVNVQAHDFEKVEKRYIDEKRLYTFMCNLYPDDLKYDEFGYEIFRNLSLLNAAIKKHNFFYAKKYSSILIKMNVKNMKVVFSKYWLTFKLYALYKDIYKKIKLIIKGHKK